MTKRPKPTFITRILLRLADPAQLFYLLPYFMLLILSGTMAQKFIGLFPATHLVFESWIIWLGVLPLPGGLFILTAITINLLAHFITRSQWHIAALGTTLAHLGVLVLLLGGVVTLTEKSEGLVVLRPGQKTDAIYDYDLNKTGKTLPFTVTLTHFSQDYYPGTNLAREYESDIMLITPNTSWPAHITMNRPYRYNGYTLYQSSVLNLSQGEEVSVLNVVKNSGWLFPYLGSALLFLGLGWHAVMRGQQRSKMILTLLFCLVMPQLAHAMDNTYFAQIPVMHEGRIKPLARMASLYQAHINADAHQEPTQFLASLLFDPENAAKTPFFKINDPALEHILNVPSRDAYSFIELNDAFITHADLVRAAQDNAEPSAEQRKFLALYADVVMFEQLKNAMTAFLPIKSTGKTYFNLPMKDKRAQSLAQRGAFSENPRMIAVRDKDRLQWLSPWQAILSKQDNPALALWRHTSLAYLHHDDATWRKSTNDLLQLSLKTSGDRFLGGRLKLELLYHQIKPDQLSAWCYALALIFCLWPRTKKIGLAALLCGIALHGTGLLMRMIVLQRPPVSTLYESLYFVGLLTVILGVLLNLRARNRLIFAATAFAGIVLHLVGFSILGDQDHFKPLQAVLNSNFWLGTHVIMITCGYALCVLTGLLAHLYLLTKNGDWAQSLQRRSNQLAVWSLLFVAIGTVLGGIWADQSWGRFWGWDPKENGALLIVLWLVWLLHGRLSGHLTAQAGMFGLAALTIMTALSWIGTNLLGVGLHSYGFTSGIAAGFAVYVGCEILFFAFCFWRLRRAPR